jgi:copper chaperone CopZ
MEQKIGKIKFQLEGITCAGCAEDMVNILSNKDGVLSVSVSYAERTIDIEYDSSVTDANNLFTEVKRLGFKTKVAPSV